MEHRSAKNFTLIIDATNAQYAKVESEGEDHIKFEDCDCNNLSEHLKLLKVLANKDPKYTTEIQQQSITI